MLPERLKSLRLEAKLTQKEIANKLEIGQGTYARYEKGDRKPTGEILNNLANLFNVSTDYLLGNTDERYVKTDLKSLSLKKKKTFGERLKFLREEQKLSQSELAKLLNTTSLSVAEWESNKIEPNSSTLKKISNVLNVYQGYLSGKIFTEEEFSFLEYPDDMEKIPEEAIPDLAAKLREQFINNQKMFNEFYYTGYGIKLSNKQIEKFAYSAVEQILEERQDKLNN